MTLRTDGVGWCAKLLRMGVVAVRARHAGGVHATLQEGPMRVDLVALLAIRVIETLCQKGRPESILKPLRLLIGELAAPGMSGGADINLLVGPAIFGAGCRAG